MTRAPNAAGDVDRGQAHASARAGDQDDFAGPDHRALLEREPRRAVHLHERGADREVDLVGKAEQLLREGEDVIRERTLADGRHHAVADIPTLDAFTHRVDHAGGFASRHVGRLGCKLVLARGLQGVDERRPGGLDRDADLPGRRVGGCDLFEHEVAVSAVRSADDRAHPPTVCAGGMSTEREAERSSTLVEELDLELPIGDRSGLPDELVEAGLDDRALAVGVHVEAVRVARRLAVESHAEPTRCTDRSSREDQVHVPSVEAVHDRRVRLV